MYDTPLREMPRDHCISYTVIPFFRFLRFHSVTISTVILCLFQITSLRAQERVRTAAQQLEIESFRNPLTFFRIGPLEEVLIGSVGVGYTDNANLTPTAKVSDLSFTQELSLNSTWVISHLNELQFNFAGQVTENFYGNGQNVVNFAISPGSLIQFKFAVSNVRVRLYDQLANVQNPTTDPTATDVANLNSFTNTGWRQIWVGSPPTLVRGVDLRLQSPRSGYVFEHLHSKFTFISSQLCVLTGTLDGNSPAIPSRR